MNAPTPAINKQLDEMTEEELAFERTRNWTICKSDTGFWIRVDEAPHRYYGCHQWEDALKEAVDHLEKHGIRCKTYIFY